MYMPNIRDILHAQPFFRLRRPREAYAKTIRLYRDYPHLRGIPVGYLRFQMPFMSREGVHSALPQKAALTFGLVPSFISFALEPPLMLPGQSVPSTFLRHLYCPPSHIFAIPVFFLNEIMGYLTFPIHDMVFMVMCPKLKGLPISHSEASPSADAIEIPVVEYPVPAPYSFAIFQEHIYTMNYDRLWECFLGIRREDFEKDRDAYLSQISTESVFDKMALVLGFYKNVCYFGFHDEGTFNVIENCVIHLVRARRFRTGATSRFT